MLQNRTGFNRTYDLQSAAILTLDGLGVEAAPETRESHPIAVAIRGLNVDRFHRK
jgi:hypothetical protein